MSSTWTTNADAFAQWIERNAGDVVRLDTEFMRRDSYYPKLALVQIAAGEGCALVDPLAFDAAPGLRSLVTGRVCVMHSAGEDMEALAPQLDGTALRLFDTQIAAAFCGLGFGLSYRNLVGLLLGIEIAKDETRSDWLRRPLRDAQVAYAEQDVAHLHDLHARLHEQLAQRGRLAWHEEDCARLAARLQRGPADPQPQRAFRNTAAWPRARQALLRRILRWREHKARALDRPRPWLLDDATALALASQPPASPDELSMRTRGLRALRAAERAELFDVLRAPVSDEEMEQTQPIPAAPAGRNKSAVAAMKARVDALAAAMDVAPGLLCPRRLLEEYAVTRIWPDGLQGWRRAVLEAELAPLLPD
ncbi:MAG: HRDC domain-containing protein [Proteobacteria bacterium]|nr:HRDC domain-containing protein [Pseudomonadota bacterium]